MKQFKVWHIDAYSGWSDYDGPGDCNIHKDIIMDATFSKKQVVDMFISTLNGRSVTVAKCECIDDGDVNYEPPLPEDFKRYTITKDGKKYFDKDIFLDRAKEQRYYELGLKHMLDVFIDIISHKTAKISCDYLHKLNPYEPNPTYCYSKILSEELNNTDISFNGLMHILSYSMPWNDPEFKEKERNYYDIEFPKQYKEDRLRNIDNGRKEFRRKNGKKPTKKDMKKIIHDIDYNMSRFYNPGTIAPALYPEYNCVEVKVGEKKYDPDLLSFINWLKSIDINRPIQRLPNGEVIEYRRLSLSDWKFYMKGSNIK